MDKRELLSKFLNKEITKQELKHKLTEDEPLIFELEGDFKNNEEIPPEAKGFYMTADDKKVYQDYQWYKSEAERRSIAICIISRDFTDKVLPRL